MADGLCDPVTRKNRIFCRNFFATEKGNASFEFYFLNITLKSKSLGH